MDNIDRLRNLYRSHFGTDARDAAALPVSGSHRLYFRLAGDAGPVIGVIGTDVRENMAFCSIGSHFRSKGIKVPEIFAAEEDMSAYLQEDLGDTTLFDALAPCRDSGVYDSAAEALLHKAVADLATIQYAGAEGLDFSLCHPFSSYGRRLVMFDLDYFKYCFLKASGVEFDEMPLQTDFEKLADDVASIPHDTFMYRDFQSRNIMVRDGQLYYIDFQGGMQGFPYYDLASFAWQARARYPQKLRASLCEAYLDAARRYRDIDTDTFSRDLRLSVLIRTLQVLGAYGFRGYFERKGHFLKSIPAAVENIRELLSEPYRDYPYLNLVLERIVSAHDSGKLVPALGGDGAAGSKSGQDGAGKVAAGTGVLTVTVWSFSYRKGIPEDPTGNGGGYVFDCRAVHNPGKYECYRSLTGMDEPVRKFLEDDGEILAFLENVYALVDAHVKRFLERGFTSLTVCFGCTGGRHRSVYCAEALARRLSGMPGVRVHLIHREQGIDREM